MSFFLITPQFSRFLVLIILLCFIFFATPIASYTQTSSSEIFNLRVLLIGLNPEESGQKLAEIFFQWQMGGKSSEEVENLIAQKNISAFRRLSENTIQYSIAKTIRLDKFPPYKNGFTYNFDKFRECTTGDPSGNCERQKFQFDSEKWVVENRICEIAQENNIDEIWLIVPPYITAWENFMIGPKNGFNVNGSSYSIPNCTKNYVVMAANYDRPETILHIYSHRTEATLNYLSSFWKVQDRNRFIINFLGWDQKQSTSVRPYPSPFCGDAHYPSNGIKDYDYSNNNYKDSTCVDWRNFPFFEGEISSVNCRNWNCNDSDWQEYWLGKLPRNAGETEMISKNGVSFRVKNNWWYYLLYPENAITFYKLTQGIVFPSPTLTVSPIPTSTITPTITPVNSPTPNPCLQKQQGDANCDGKVNLLDFFVWRREFLLGLSEAKTYKSDFNNDKTINLFDFFVWRKNFLKLI